MQTRYQYLDYLSFQGVNRRFVLSFQNNAYKTIYKRCFLPTVEISDHNVKIDGENFFDLPVKNDLKTYQVKEMITPPVVY